MTRWRDALPDEIARGRCVSSRGRGQASRERFLTELTLGLPQATSDKSGAPHLDEDYLILSTIHSAKGKEWQSVQVLNVVDGCLPVDMSTGSARQVDEERRLLYVAMTQARQRLHLLVPQRFYVARFTPAPVAAPFVRVGPRPWRGRRASAAGHPTAEPDPMSPLDVGARLRSAW